MYQNTHSQLGFGLGLRAKHYPYIFDHKPKVDWFEIISENFMDTGGRPRRNLARIKEHYPIVMHGVALSIGTVDPLNSEYLRKLKQLSDWVQPAWISDHLCWTGVAHKNTHDLLPVPYTEEALQHIIKRIRAVQDFLERPIALENPSTYLEFSQSSMPEAEFIARMAEESGCNLLLDVNNIYVTCYNHRLDVKTYLDTLPLDRVIQIHLSGHTNKGTHIIDTHDAQVIDEVWNIYKYVVHKAERVPNTMIEWDNHIPDFPEFYAELEKAKLATKTASEYILPDLFCEPQEPRLNYQAPLPEAQNHMQEAILKGPAFDSAPDNWIRNKESFSPQEQLNVYINAYRYRLYDVVAEDYPVLKDYLGQKDFHDLIWSFVNAAQPDHFNIARYALKMSGFIEAERPQDIFAHELCALETTIAQIADAQETQPLKQDHLEGMTAASLMETHIYPRGASQIFAFSYPVNAYYQKVMDELKPDKPQPEASYLAVFRHDDTVWRMDLEKSEHALLDKLFAGQKVGDALEAVDESAAGDLSAWFSRWISNGLLAAHDYTQSEEVNYETAA
jgi:uncharacterized protein (UPF0276 family)